MNPRPGRLRLHGAASERAALDWSWVSGRLASAGTYWVVAKTSAVPHPRPVWGTWHDDRLHLSIGSPTITRELHSDPMVAVHLESGTDVVIVEGSVLTDSTTAEMIDHYNRKYDWDYRIGEYGELTIVQPVKVLAWQAAGWAGRESFQATGCWLFDRP